MFPRRSFTGSGNIPDGIVPAAVPLIRNAGFTFTAVTVRVWVRVTVRVWVRVWVWVWVRRRRVDLDLDLDLGNRGCVEARHGVLCVFACPRRQTYPGGGCWGWRDGDEDRSSRAWWPSYPSRSDPSSR